MNTPHRQQGSILSSVLLLLIVALGAYIGWQYSQKDAAPVTHEDTNKHAVIETAETKPVDKEATASALTPSNPPATAPIPAKQVDIDPTSPSPSPTKKQVVTEAITDIIETTTSEVVPSPIADNTENEAGQNENVRSRNKLSELTTTEASENTTELNPATDATTAAETEKAVETAIAATISPVIIDQTPVATLPIRLRYKDHFQPNRIIVLTVEIENNTSELLETVIGDVVLSLESKEIARLNLGEHDILAKKNKAHRYQLAAQQSKTWGVEIAETRLPALYETLSVTPVEQFQVQFIQAEK